VKHFGSLFVAYLVVWAVFFGYQVTIASRMARLREELDELKGRLKGK
jgi:CcmD family protein